MAWHKSSTIKLKTYFFLTAFVIGIIHAWLTRYVTDSDATSHLDMGDAFFQGNRMAIINGFWNPLYALIMGFFLSVFKPISYYELIVIHFVNFFIYILSFFCFDFFLEQLIKYNKQKEVNLSKTELTTLPQWAWYSLGYSLFIWSSMNLTTISAVAPDLCTNAIIYLSSGILLKIKSGSANWFTFVVLGIVLGLGYLLKPVMFSIAFIVLGVAIFAISDLKRGVLYVLITLLVFFTVASPYIILLSKSKGRLTFGETGNILYHWDTNCNACQYLNLGFPGCKQFTHPVRIIFNSPLVLEYSTPFNVTYPLVYDPSYWCDGGLKAYFDLKGQILALLKSFKEYFTYLFFQTQGILLTGYLILSLISSRKWLCLKDIKNEWVLVTMPLLAMSMYSILHVEARYIGAFVTLLWLGLFSSLKLPDSKEIKKFVSCLIIILSTFMLITSLFSEDLLENRLYAKELSVNWDVAKSLQKIGIQKGDKVGVIGICDDYYWARLTRVHIIAEIPLDEEIANFWAADSFVKSQVLQAFKKAGTKMVIAGRAPAYASKLGWKNIKDTSYYFYVL